jgi:hypothetical protein
MEKLNPYKQATGRVINAIQRGASTLGKTGAFGPAVQGMMSPFGQGAGAQVGGFLQDSARGFESSGVTQALDSYAAPKPGMPAMTGRVNVPAGQTMQPNGQLLGGAQPTQPPKPMATQQAPATPQTTPSPVTPQPTPITQPEPVQDEVSTLQDDMSQLKQSRDKEWFDIYTPKGQKTVTGAGGLAGLVETEYNNKNQTIADKLANAQAARKLESDTRQQGFDNNIKQQELQLKREALALESRRASQGGSLSITDQIKLKEYQDGIRQSANRATTSYKLLDQLQDLTRNPIVFKSLEKSGLFSFMDRGLASVLDPQSVARFEAIKQELSSKRQLAEAAQLKGVASDTDMAIIRGTDALNNARTPADMRTAITRLQQELAQSLTDEELAQVISQ